MLVKLLIGYGILLLIFRIDVKENKN